MKPIIDDATFEGEDKGLAPPVRRTTDGPYRLSIRSLDREDPPGYRLGGVPRSDAFNGNVFALQSKGGMPTLDIDCEVSGFDPAATPLLWRLQSLHVLCRYRSLGTDAQKTPHYAARIRRLEGEWRGESRSPRFTALQNGAAESDHVGGGHAVLTVAARPPGSSGWLQDFVHLRLIGTNPSEEAGRAFVASLVGARGSPLLSMLLAIFAWEAKFKQFRTTRYGGDRYAGTSFRWPADPADFPIASFDFGIGMSQFTDPGRLNASIAWDWRDNLRAGINVFLGKLRACHRPGITWHAWALRAWQRYNGSGERAKAYAKRLSESSDGKAVPSTKVPASLDLVAFTAPLALATPPDWPAWPVTELAPGTESIVAADDALAEHGIAAIAETVAKRVPDPALIAWLWPQLERELLEFDPHNSPPPFPGLPLDEIAAFLRGLDDDRVRHALRAALLRAQSLAAGPGATLETLDGAQATGDLLSEWGRLSTFVRENITNGFAGFGSTRDRLYARFDAPGDPNRAIPRVNAYYASMVAAEFPRAKFKSPVHPTMRDRLQTAAALLAAKGERAAGDAVKSVGGFAIRPNVNRQTELSNHSFGWAIDIDPERNPNIPKAKLPLHIIQAFTGLDLYGPESERMRNAAPYATLLPAAQTITAASAAFIEAFRNRAALRKAFGSAVIRLCAIRLDADALDRTEALAAAGHAKALGALLSSAGAPDAKAAAASRVLIEAAILFKRAAKATKPKILGDAATLARFGFCNLAPELIAALVANDGGGLHWLGSANATKDYMHFELRSSDRPSLIL
ncbi:M15 family metallopeptidase [Methylobacterium fujisawaense]